LVYDQHNESTDMVFSFDKKLVVSRIKLVFNVGAIQPEGYNIDFPDLWAGSLYHIPEVSFYRGNDLNNLSFISKSDGMILSKKEDGSPSYREVFYDIDSSVSSLGSPNNFFKLSFRFRPTEDEIEEFGIGNYFSFCSNRVEIISVIIYTMELVSAEETIKTYERRYHVSYGDYGDFPPGGSDTTGSLLYYNPSDTSSIYHIDFSNGMVGLPNSAGELKTMNKCRGRIMKSCVPDKTTLPGNSVYLWEMEQKKIHDEIAINSGKTSTTMRGVLPPSLEDKLLEVGVSLSNWKSMTCSFNSTIVRPLASMLQPNPYSPCGHAFYHDLTTMNLDKVERCGFGAWRYDVFDYSWANACTGTMAGIQLDVLDVYAKAIGGILFGNNLLEGKSSSYALKEGSKNQTTEDITPLSLPDAVKPFV